MWFPVLEHVQLRVLHAWLIQALATNLPHQIFPRERARYSCDWSQLQQEPKKHEFWVKWMQYFCCLHGLRDKWQNETVITVLGGVRYQVNNNKYSRQMQIDHHLQPGIWSAATSSDQLVGIALARADTAVAIMTHDISYFAKIILWSNCFLFVDAIYIQSKWIQNATSHFCFVTEIAKVKLLQLASYFSSFRTKTCDVPESDKDMDEWRIP